MNKILFQFDLERNSIKKQLLFCWLFFWLKNNLNLIYLFYLLIYWWWLLIFYLFYVRIIKENKIGLMINHGYPFIECFVVLAETEHFGEASSKLCISQPAPTKQKKH